MIADLFLFDGYLTERRFRGSENSWILRKSMIFKVSAAGFLFDGYLTGIRFQLPPARLHILHNPHLQCLALRRFIDG